MSFVTQVKLTNFRCYEQAALHNIQSGLVVLCGANGAGKTNILEALSLLTPGRGLRGATAEEMQKQNANQSWGIAATIDTQGAGDVMVGTGLDSQSGRRIVRINGVDASQNALTDYISCLWLTPQMDRLFMEGAAARRRFLDRLIFTFDGGHSGRVTRYENAMRQRSRILQESPSYDTRWLKGLELQMAETAISICAARLDFIQRLQHSCDIADSEEDKYFPKARLQAIGTLENLLERTPALEVEQIYTYQLEQSRSKDALTGGAATGPHKSDLSVHYRTKNIEAGHCSTGEQKALLIGLILSHGRMVRAEKGWPPVLLLDEIVAHLDADRREALFERLSSMGGQVWMTGTDAILFDYISQKAQFFVIDSARIQPQKLSVAA